MGNIGSQLDITSGVAGTSSKTGKGECQPPESVDSALPLWALNGAQQGGINSVVGVSQEKRRSKIDARLALCVRKVQTRRPASE
jgi:hypothetical protein